MSRQGFIYIRQSRHKKYQRTVSPEVQEEEARKLPAIQSCAQVSTFHDLDLSGKSVAGRRDWLALRQLLEASRKGDEIVVALYDQSRAFRNTAEALEFYALMERMPWVEVVMVMGSFDRSPAGEFTYTSMAAANAFERRMTAEKIRAAKAYASARGEAVGPVPYGYRRDVETGEMSVDEEAAAVVRRIFEDYAGGGHSTMTLARRLNDEGARNSRRTQWLPDTVAQMLGNVAYTGKTYAASRRRRDGDIIQALWPALVSDEMYKQVEARRLRNTRSGGHGPALVYAYSRLLRCRCGRRLRVTRNSASVYYYCRRDIVDRCGTPTVREDRLLPWGDVLFEALDAIRPDGFQAAMDRAEGRRQSPDAIAQVDATLGRLLQLFQWGDITPEHYKAERDRLGDLRKELILTTAPQPTIHLDGLLATWRSGDPIARNRILGLLFDALHVKDGEIVSFTPRADRAAEVIALIDQAIGRRVENERLAVVGGEMFAGTEREGFEPSNRVAPVTAFPVPRPRPD